MRKDVVLVTGASGEMGQALINRLAENGVHNILALDVRAMPESLQAQCQQCIVGDVLDDTLMSRLISEFSIPRVFHLAALLSTRGEFTPETAHRVNVDGTLGLLKLAVDQAQWLGRPVKFIFPSSIAAYGLPDLETKANAGAVKEWAWNNPTTMYGCNKLYAEHLGRYYTHYYRQLAAEKPHNKIDFRSIRFPGLISAFTVPSGGTSDYGPEMLHAAAQDVPYACFVREDTTMPFMAMPDAVKSLLMLEAAPQDALTTHVYNVTSFKLSAKEFHNEVLRAFPHAQITFKPDDARQGIVDSWPENQDDSRARRDWGWTPDYDLRRAFDEYLVPNIKRRYARATA
ncbi:MAG: NAD-dependent epimerase/dehydratase family protein [Anaerolineae bacterium]|nr:NAD-dependent epimerase/dehydratase family protein [Anaerolineae bacterium]